MKFRNGKTKEGNRGKRNFKEKKSGKLTKKHIRREVLNESGVPRMEIFTAAGAAKGIAEGVASNFIYDALKDKLKFKIGKEVEIFPRLVMNIQFKECYSYEQMDSYVGKLLHREYSREVDTNNGLQTIKFKEKKIYYLYDMNIIYEPFEMGEFLGSESIEESGIEIESKIDAVVFYVYSKQEKIADLILDNRFLNEIRNKIQEKFDIKKDSINLSIEIYNEIIGRKLQASIKERLMLRNPNVSVLFDKDIDNHMLLRIKRITDLDIEEVSEIFEEYGRFGYIKKMIRRWQ